MFVLKAISTKTIRAPRVWPSEKYARFFPPVHKPPVHKPRSKVSPCVNVYKLFLNASPVVTTVEEVISHEIIRKEPLRRSKRIAALKKKNAPLRRSPRIASMEIRPNYKE